MEAPRAQRYTQAEPRWDTTSSPTSGWQLNHATPRGLLGQDVL